MSSLPVFYDATPELTLDGQDRAAYRQVMAALVEDAVDSIARCEILLENWQADQASGGGDYAFQDRSQVDFGMTVDLQLVPNQPISLFNGRVTALEAGYALAAAPTLTVLAEDRLQDLRMTRRTRTFEKMTGEDVFRQIASEHSLSPDVRASGPQHESIAQVNQSDLAFIRQLAGALGAEVWVKGRTLCVRPRAPHTPSQANGGPIELTYGVNLSAFTVRADLAHQCTELLVTGWDVSNKAAIAETAGASVISSELNGGVSGPDLLKKKFGERKAQLVHTVPMTTAQARGLARAQFAERARRFVVGTGRMNSGDPNLVVGAAVTLSHLGRLFDGDYTVVRVRHTFDRANGFQTEFDVERPAISR